MPFIDLKKLEKDRADLEERIAQVKADIERGIPQDREAARVVSRVRDFNATLYGVMQESLGVERLAFCRYRENTDSKSMNRGHEVAKSQWTLIYEFESEASRRVLDGCKACYKKARRENKKVHLAWRRQGGYIMHAESEGMLGDLVPRGVKYEPGQVPESISTRYALPARLAVTIDLLRSAFQKKES